MHHIAHVEDSQEDHTLLLKALRGQYRITHFKTLTAFRDGEARHDLIIADLGLPETFGVETLKAIRAHDPHTPILALTGLGGPYITGDIVKSMMDAGADNIISKEIICDERVLSIISDLLKT